MSPTTCKTAGGYDYFPFFADLPIEIQTLVWEFAAHIPRNVEICVKDVGCISTGEEDYKAFRFHTWRKTPSILHATKLSRAVGLQFYSLKFGFTLELSALFSWTAPARIYFNQASDRLCPIGTFHPDQTVLFCYSFLNTHAYRGELPVSLAVNLSDRDQELKFIGGKGSWSVFKKLRELTKRYPEELLYYYTDASMMNVVNDPGALEFVPLDIESDSISTAAKLSLQFAQEHVRQEVEYNTKEQRETMKRAYLIGGEEIPEGLDELEFERAPIVKLVSLNS